MKYQPKKEHIHFWQNRKPIKNKKNQLIGFYEICTNNCIAIKETKNGHECVLWGADWY